jgi:hypothetical protein
MKFQFSIRDLLILVAFLALAAGWWIDHQRIAKLGMQQWDYKRSSTVWDDAELKGLGDQGWEACGVVGTFDGNSHGAIILFKRPK